MKRRDLLAHLSAHGCALLREGARHSWWSHLNLGYRSAVPRHREINEWIAWTGSMSAMFLAVTFLLQGVSLWINNESMIHFAFQALDQRWESSAGNLFYAWCIAVLLIDSRGTTRIVGAVAIALAVGMRGYAFYLSSLSRSLSAEAPALQVLALLPFVWLVFESKKKWPLESMG